jgi:hypothetical protein
LCADAKQFVGNRASQFAAASLRFQIMGVAKLTLPDKLGQLARARAAERGCKSLEEYVRLLIREDSPSPIDEKLEAELLASLRGPARKVTRQFWSEKRRKLLQSHRRAVAG